MTNWTDLTAKQSRVPGVRRWRKWGPEISAELVILKRSLQRWLFISSIDERHSLPGV